MHNKKGFENLVKPVNVTFAYIISYYALYLFTIITPKIILCLIKKCIFLFRLTFYWIIKELTHNLVFSSTGQLAPQRCSCQLNTVSLQQPLLWEKHASWIHRLPHRCSPHQKNEVGGWVSHKRPACFSLLCMSVNVGNCSFEIDIYNIPPTCN